MTSYVSGLVDQTQRRAQIAARPVGSRWTNTQLYSYEQLYNIDIEENTKGEHSFFNVNPLSATNVCIIMYYTAYVSLIFSLGY